LNAFSLTLVIAQFGLIALILSPVRNLLSWSVAAQSGFILIGASTLLALWAIATMRLANFSVLPEPVKHGKLITAGPYRFIRHPMYTAVVCACLGATISHGMVINWIWLLGLVVILTIKIRREEALLRQRYQAYDQYSKHTNALIPYLF